MNDDLEALYREYEIPEDIRRRPADDPLRLSVERYFQDVKRSDADPEYARRLEEQRTFERIRYGRRASTLVDDPESKARLRDMELRTERYLEWEFEQRLAEIQAMNRARHKTRLEDDEFARETYETGVELKRRNPKMTGAQIAGHLGISDSTWARYKRRLGRGKGA